MLLRYLGHVGKPSGYSVAACDTLRAFLSVGGQLDIQLLPDARLDPTSRFLGLYEYVDRHRHFEVSHAIVHAVPAALPSFRDRLRPHHGPVIAMTTWETNRVTGEAVEILKSFDAVIVPCEWNAFAMLKAGIERIFVLPHCFDFAWWSAKGFATSDSAARAVTRTTPNSTTRADDATTTERVAPFTFYSILTWSERKNPIGLLKAYWTAFRSGENVLLKIVTPSYNAAEVGVLRESFPPEWQAKLPPVEFVSKLHDEALRELHHTADCYVTLARGEAWGLGAFEAACLGQPVIAPAYGGFLDFLGKGLSDTYFVDVRETPAIVPPMESSHVTEIAGLKIRPVVHTIHDGVCGDQLWAEPSILQTATHMQTVYRARDAYRATWTRPSLATAAFTYQTVGHRLLRILEAISA